MRPPPTGSLRTAASGTAVLQCQQSPGVTCWGVIFKSSPKCTYKLRVAPRSRSATEVPLLLPGVFSRPLRFPEPRRGPCSDRRCQTPVGRLRKLDPNGPVCGEKAKTRPFPSPFGTDDELIGVCQQFNFSPEADNIAFVRALCERCLAEQADEAALSSSPFLPKPSLLSFFRSPSLLPFRTSSGKSVSQ